MLFYTPDKSLIGIDSVVTQHIDIMPTVLDILGYNKPFISFGESVFRKRGWAIHHNNNRYCLITQYGFLNNRNENYRTFSDWSFKNKLVNNNEDVVLLKSFKQSFSSSMIKNKLTFDGND